MITEDYVSFEIAKLLKEKGFDWECEHVIWEGADDNYENYDKAIPNPTHQMAMKWLREKGIHMSIDTVISSSGNIYFNIDTYSEDSGWNHPVDFYDSYEEAVETALKYVLKNLI